MTVLLLLLSCIASFLSGITAFLIAVSFTKTQRSRYPLLRRLDGRQLVLTMLFVICGLAATTSGFAYHRTIQREQQVETQKQTQVLLEAIGRPDFIEADRDQRVRIIQAMVGSREVAVELEKLLNSVCRQAQWDRRLKN